MDPDAVIADWSPPPSHPLAYMSELGAVVVSVAESGELFPPPVAPVDVPIGLAASPVVQIQPTEERSKVAVFHAHERVFVPEDGFFRYQISACDVLFGSTYCVA